MSLAADVAIAAAERVERAGGPRAGLAVWRKIASNTEAVELRGRAILKGLRSAMALRDQRAFRDLCLLWRTVDEGVWDGIFALCKDAARTPGLGVLFATGLAEAETKRLRTARALYVYARCLDVAGDPRAPAAFGEAALRADSEGALELGRSPRIRRAVWLARSSETLAEAIAEAKGLASTEATPGERLALARVLLRSPSRFVRAGAIDLLDDLVSAVPHSLAGGALRLAAAHADAMGDTLTPLEAGRLHALMMREPIAKETARAREVLRVLEQLARAGASDAAFDAALEEAARLEPELAELHRRARDILRGRFEVHETSREAPLGRTEAWAVMLDAVVSMRDAAWANSARTLRMLCDAVERGERWPSQLWTVAEAALGKDDAAVRAVAGRLVAAMLCTASSSPPPPRGWLGLADALAACGMNELATNARRAATLANEAGAAEAFGLALTRSGWELALAGERSRAIERLREARALASRAASSPST